MSRLPNEIIEIIANYAKPTIWSIVRHQPSISVTIGYSTSLDKAKQIIVDYIMGWQYVHHRDIISVKFEIEEQMARYSNNEVEIHWKDNRHLQFDFSIEKINYE